MLGFSCTMMQTWEGILVWDMYMSSAPSCGLILRSIFVAGFEKYVFIYTCWSMADYIDRQVADRRGLCMVSWSTGLVHSPCLPQWRRWHQCECLCSIVWLESNLRGHPPLEANTIGCPCLARHRPASFWATWQVSHLEKYSAVIPEA